MVNNAQYLVTLFLVVFTLCFVAHASALVQETTYLGRVTAMDPLSLTLTIRAESQYGCSYSGGTPSCAFSSIDPVQVVGTVPDEGVFNTFHNGDLVAATILGDTGGKWAAIALVIVPPGSGTYLVSDIYGDPRTIPLDLGADYQFDYSTLPDCSACSGSVCKALSARVVVKSGESVLLEQSLNNGQSARYSGRNDGSWISILYISGEASADTCAGASPATGIQPVSSFVIHINPPVGGFTAPTGTPSPGETKRSMEKPLQTTEPERTRAGAFLLTPLGAMGGIALLYRIRGKRR
ncbi:MAG: hypothetical protein QHH04_01325 [Methanolinea sp.]|jgi:hypothetical protein|nr:hypothetical protein [Methanolinea sp.]